MNITVIITSDDRTQEERHTKALRCLAEQTADAKARGYLDGLVHVRDDVIEPLSRTTQIVSIWERAVEKRK